MDESPEQSVAQYTELVREQDRLRLYGVLQLSLESVAKVFSVGAGHTHVLAHARVGNSEKWGRAGALLDNGTSWDETLRFNVAVVPWRRHPLNLVKLTLYSFGGGGDHQEGPLCEIGAAMFHVHDMIKATDDGACDDTFLLWDEFQTVGELRLGVDFNYGEFGQGKSERVAWEEEVPATNGTDDRDSDEAPPFPRPAVGAAGFHGDAGECFESLYLAAAAQEHDTKAARAGRARYDSFTKLHTQLGTRDERVAYVRHQMDSMAAQLPQRGVVGTGDSENQSREGLQQADLSGLAGLLPL